jgi:predicted P-loop ATPase
MRILLDAIFDQKNWTDLITSQAKDSLDEAISTTPQLKGLLERHPGLRPHLATTLHAWVADVVRARLDVKRAEYSRVFAREISQRQIAAAARFFSTSGGREMMTRAIKLAPEEEDGTDDPELEKIAKRMSVDPKEVEAFIEVQRAGGLDAIFDLISKVEDSSEESDAFFEIYEAELRDVAARTVAAYVAEQDAKAQLR